MCAVFALFASATLSQEHSIGQPLKDLNGFFPFHVPESIEDWEKRAEELRLRIRVANGIYPEPERTPLNAVIHGKVERPGFTVEKVYFESVPGFHVTGLLFRPAGAKTGAKLPAVLSPHGHGGRLQDHGKDGILKRIEIGDEKFEDSGRFPKVARCATLARLGCIVFLYDMIGYADNQQLSYQLGHRFAKQRPEFEGSKSWGLYSAQAELHLQSIFGLQTWNSIRALDFLESLPEVDPKRLAVTGGSGGGTQTIMVCAIDPRPVAAFPNGMVSSSMQGGCTCENASLLRIGTGNVELTALFAPNPQGMTAADDWTKEMLVEGKGFPELKKLYTMYGKPENVMCGDLLHFKHNYNFVTRDLMYRWFNKHLELGLNDDEVVETDFKSLTAEEHAVYNDEHPRPEGGDDFERKLTGWLANDTRSTLGKMGPDERSKVIRTAWRIMIGEPVEGQKSEVEISAAEPNGKCERVILWTAGKTGRDIIGNDEAEKLATDSTRLVGLDLFAHGIKETPTVANKREYAGYTHGYNHSIFARRVHGILDQIEKNRAKFPDAEIVLIGTEGAGPVVLAAALRAGDDVSKTLVDGSEFRFRNITSYRDPNFIPGAVKYIDMMGLTMSIPKEKLRAVKGTAGDEDFTWLSQ
ncbi:MAG: acetylxylan esterase [Verrucomicrobiales bacterium]|nr:acetylxylan esterase [Verrucomicrobiales bacterium]